MTRFNRFELLTFDCYGTLIDWETGILNAVRPVLERHRIDLSDEDILEFYARSEASHEQGAWIRYELVLQLVMQDLSRRLGFSLTPDEQHCIAASLPEWPPFPDTVAALGRLKTKYKLAIISNIDDALFDHSAERLQVEFDWIVTAQQAGAYKPSHRTFEYAFERFGLPRERILHVAQSIYHDHVPARELGISSVWVNRRGNRPGGGATPHAGVKPAVEVPDLKSLVKLVGL